MQQFLLIEVETQNSEGRIKVECEVLKRKQIFISNRKKR